MNSSYGSFEFAGGWQEDLFPEAPNYLEGSLPSPTSGQIDAAGNYQEISTASTPEEWLLAHSQRPQQAGVYNTSASFDFEYLQTLPTYSTSQGYAYEPDLTDLSDIDQCQSHSSFSEPDFDHLQATHYGGTECNTNSFQSLPRTSPNLAHFYQGLANTSAANNNVTSPVSYNHGSTIRRDPTNHQVHLINAPPTQNLSPNDPLYPRQQPSRSEEDLYTPTYVRGDGPTRAGWCARCSSWLTLKDSAYWYHMHFAHGITAAGKSLPRPIMFRASAGAARGVGDKEALCGTCGRWVLVVTGEKGHTAWWRHSYRCKLKDGAGSKERRRGKSASPRKVAAKPAIGRS